MPKKKSPPDYRYSGFAEIRECFSEEKAREIKTRFGFGPKFALHAELNNAAALLQRRKSNPESTPNVLQREFDMVLMCAKALDENLQKLGTQAHFETFQAANQRFDLESDDVVASLHSRLQEFMGATADASQCARLTSRGRYSDWAEEAFLFTLRRIYVAGTERRDVATRNTYDGRPSYSGNFFEFLRECLIAVGIQKSDSRIFTLARQTASYDSELDAAH